MTPPAPAAELTLPPIDVISVPHRNGANLVLSPLRTVPLLQAHLAVETPLRTAAEMAAMDVLAATVPTLHACTAFEAVGGQVAVTRRQQWLMISLTCVNQQVGPLADALAAIVCLQASDRMVDQGRTKAAQQATLVSSVPAVASARRLWEAYYGRIPLYVEPTAPAHHVEQVTADDVRHAHRTLRPEQAHLVVVGDLDPEPLLSRLENALACWPSTPAPRQEKTTAMPPAADRGPHLRHRPGWSQTHLRLAAPCSTRQDLPRFAAAQVASLLLGGNFSSRINTDLRERHGLAYRTSAALTDHLDSDVIVIEADVAPNNAAGAWHRLNNVLEDFAENGPTGEELRTAVRHTVGKYTLGLGEQTTRAACLMSYLTSGLGPSGVTDIPRAIAALTQDDVRDIAHRWHPTRMHSLLCGDLTADPDTADLT
ncbi:pitrilysin family protein [Streptomyces sp. SID12501]|uniref:Insulinase family protein n=1 Tax=Streptomyces sp. SID12501 TaxID=2706042 RepID=A0A6B3BJI9_9ACTN|nr:insulinase family protein [Streptomyces sp. SID12501]NEC84715.1 insulinase family protein [Streptomyces sp. SID12501]